MKEKDARYIRNRQTCNKVRDRKQITLSMAFSPAQQIKLSEYV